MDTNSINSVVMNGYIASDLVERELADGSTVTQWRFKVPRKNESGSDSIPCSSTSAVVLKVLNKANADCVYEAEGEIRSRFWNSGGVTGSRVEVNVTKLRKLKITTSA